MRRPRRRHQTRPNPPRRPAFHRMPFPLRTIVRERIVDSDHRGRLQLAIARAESMSADRACAILKYSMDDVLRSGLSLRQWKRGSAIGREAENRIAET
mmetsp:Transcript_38253/g.62597  ORF Transcript_38253/g.62597 Transcript_38253/m.62597 type:complete len:98 (+) Transcript_38253:400-693(+)